MRFLYSIGIVTILLAGCDALTLEEARQALEESNVASQALALCSSSTTITKSDSGIEVETDFTIGDSVQKHAEKIREFIESQVSCAEYETLSDGTLKVQYGVMDGDCSYLGHQYSGSHSIRVERVEESKVVIYHKWDDFSNQILSVSGEATVTWNRETSSRSIQHQLQWTRMRDKKAGIGAGDRTQRPLDNSILNGITIQGSRSWEGELGRWDLDIDNIEARWVDPVPQSGTWHLDTPFDKSLRLSFDRVDEDTIEVTVESGNRSFDFHVSKRGAISRAD